MSSRLPFHLAHLFQVCLSSSSLRTKIGLFFQLSCERAKTRILQECAPALPEHIPRPHSFHPDSCPFSGKSIPFSRHFLSHPIFCQRDARAKHGLLPTLWSLISFRVYFSSRPQRHSSGFSSRSKELSPEFRRRVLTHSSCTVSCRVLPHSLLICFLIYFSPGECKSPAQSLALSLASSLSGLIFQRRLFGHPSGLFSFLDRTIARGVQEGAHEHIPAPSLASIPPETHSHLRLSPDIHPEKLSRNTWEGVWPGRCGGVRSNPAPSLPAHRLL